MITETDNVYLGPCKGSLYDVIKRHGSNYHNSPEAIKAREKASEAYLARRKSLQAYLNEIDIPLKMTSELLYKWDGSKRAKDMINDRWNDHLEDEFQESQNSEYQHYKERSEKENVPISFYYPEMFEEEDDRFADDNHPSDEDDPDRFGEDTYEQSNENPSNFVNEDGFEVVSHKK